jgi:hypothetical protein
MGLQEVTTFSEFASCFLAKANRLKPSGIADPFRFPFVYPKMGTQLYLECATRHRVYVTHAVSH